MSTADYSLPPGPLRSDALLIRHLAKPDNISIPGNPTFDARIIYPKLAQIYHRLPLFVLPDNIPWLFEHEDDLLEFLGHPLRRPYDDLILDFPLAGEVIFKHALDSGPASDRPPRPMHLWVRVRSVAQALRDPDLIWPSRFLLQPLRVLLDEVIPLEERNPSGAPISEQEILDDAEGWLLCELWYRHPTGVSHYPRWILIPGDDPWSIELCHYLYSPSDDASTPEWYRGELINEEVPVTNPPSFEAIRNYMLLLDESHAKTIILGLLYLTEVAALVQVSPPPRRMEIDHKTTMLKPWLTPRPHAIISVDPERIGEFHHPSDTRKVNARHAPRPHSRRGHWRNLPPGFAKARTWIRPVWVGAREWQDPQGNTYVFLPPKQDISPSRNLHPQNH